MGTPIEDGGQVQGGENPDAGDNTPGPNPAWNDVLEVLPEQFHKVVTPHFQKWDQSAQSRIEQANAQLKQFEDYKPFVEHGINRSEIEQGLRLMWEINNNPENVYKALAEAYKFGQAPVANTDADGDEDDDDETPFGIDPEIANKLQQQEGMLQAVAQIVLNDAQAKEAAAADKALEDELSAVREKFKDVELDEDYILTKMLNGATAEQAAESYQALVQKFAPKPFAPNVLGASGGGSGVPSQAIDPTKLSGKETRNLVAQMLAQAAQQNR